MIQQGQVFKLKTKGADGQPLPDAKATTAATAVAYVGSLLLLMSLAVYGQWVLTGVVEEKNNRVVELILEAPWVS